MSDEQGVNPGLRDLISQLAINVAVLTSSLDDVKNLVAALRDSTATKESVDRMARDVTQLQDAVKAVDEKQDKKWDRLLWAIVSVVLVAGISALMANGIVGK